MWTVPYTLAQVSVIIASIFLACTYLTNNRKAILILCIISTSFFALEYLFLETYTAVLVNIIGIVRAVWFYIDEIKGKQKNYVSLIVLMVISIICGIVTYQGLVTILSSIAGMFFIVIVWQPSIKYYRLLSTCTTVLWIVHNVIAFTLFGIITEVVMFVMKIIGIIKYYKTDRFVLENNSNQSSENKV